MKLFLKTGLNPRELWKYGSGSAFLTAKFGFWDESLEVTSGLSCTDTVCVVQCTEICHFCVYAWPGEMRSSLSGVHPLNCVQCT